MKLPVSKILSLLLCACLLLFLALSLSAMVAHASHHCSTVDCEICACIQCVRSVLRCCALLLYALFASALLRGAVRLFADAVPACCATPVSMRVRMNH